MTKDTPYNFNINYLQQGGSGSGFNQEFFKPVNNPAIIPEKDFTSNSLNFASKYTNTPIAKPNRLGKNAIIEQDHLQRETGLRNAISASLKTNDGKDIGNKVVAAQMALNEGMKAQSVGDIFQQSTYPLKSKTVAKSIDLGITRDEYHTNILNNLGKDPETDTISSTFDTEHPYFTDFIKEISNTFSKENLLSLASFMPEGGATRGILEDYVSSFEKGGAAGTILEHSSILTKGLVNRLDEATGISKNATLRDAIEFASFLPVNKEVELDTMELVKGVFSKSSLEDKIIGMGEWDNKFRQRYGEDGYAHMAAFMVKEGVVDAASLALALRNPKMASALISEEKDKIFARIVKALGRATVMGLGGTGVQASMDNYLGLETDLAQEFGMRTAGIFVGEGVARGLMATGRGILGAGNRLVNGGAKLVGETGERAAAVSPEVVPQSMLDLLPQNEGTRILRETMDAFGMKEQDIVRNDLATEITQAAVEDNTQPYRDLATETLNILRRDREGSLAHIFNKTKSEIQASALGRESVKDDIMLYGVGNRLIGETVTKQTEVDNILQYYFNDGLRTVSRRQGALTGDDSFLGWKQLFSDPRNFVGDIADDLFDTLLNRDVYQKALTDAQKAAFKGIPENAKNKVLGIREEMAELSAKNPDFIVTQETLAAKGLSAKEIDSYWATGKVLDFSAILAENMMIANANKSGLKQLANGKLVKVVQTTIPDKPGYTVVKEIGKDSADTVVLASEVADVSKVLGYKRNFIPRRPKDADYLLGTLDTSSGEVQMTYASRYRGEVQNKLLELEGKSLEGGELSKVHFYFRNMTDEQSFNFGTGKDSVAIIDALDEASIKKLRESLAKSENMQLKDLDLEKLRMSLDNLTYGSIASKQIAGRQSAGLKTVTGEPFEYKPSNAAITQHLMEVSALGMKDFRNDAVAQFEKEFAGVLDPSKNWNQEIRTQLGNADVVARAKSVQSFLKRNVFQETEHGKSFRLAVDSWADGMRKQGGIKKQMVDTLERMPLIQNAFKATRDGTAFYRAAASGLVFAGNVGSFVTQVAPSVAMVVGMKGITNPLHLASGWTDMLGALSLKAGLPEAFASKEIKQSLRALEQSGILAKGEVNDLANAVYGQSSTLFNKAMFFVQQGELVNRTNIWFITRAEMIAKAKKGVLPDINNTRLLTAKDIDSTEFSQIVSQKAKQIFLDTTQAGKLKALSGVGSVLGQFTSPVIKTHTMWFAKDLSRTERVGASLGLFAFYGVNAIPFVAAGLYTADKAGAVFTGGESFEDYTLVSDMTDNLAHTLLDKVGELAGFSEEDKQFFRDTVKKGGVSTLTGGNIDLYNKMAIGLFVNQTVESMGNPLDHIPAVSILNKVAGSATHIGELLADLWEAENNPESDEQRVIDLRSTMGDIANETGNILPGFGKIVDTLNNNPETRSLLNPELEGLDNTGWVTRTGKRIEPDVEFTDMQKYLNIFGISPAPVQKNRELMKGQFDRVAILKQMGNTWKEQYKAAATDQARRDIMRQARQEANTAEEVLMATYEGALNIAIGRSSKKAYERHSLAEYWGYMFKNIEQDRIAANVTRSRGEEGGRE